MLFSLTHQIALVTGASRGIGHAIALQLAQQGAWVAGTATTTQGVTFFEETLKKLNLKGKGFILDISNKDSIHTLVAHLKKLNQLPTILVNNAGIIRDGLAINLSDDHWQEVINVNLSGAFYLTQQCLPSMLKTRYGRIIHISSVAGLSGNAGQTNYAAAKAGLIGFSKSLALEVAKRGITVNTIAPGFIKTDMAESLNEERRTHLAEQIPLKRLGTSEEVGYACAFLAARESCYITGHTLHINGGLWMN